MALIITRIKYPLKLTLMKLTQLNFGIKNKYLFLKFFLNKMNKQKFNAESNKQ